MNVNLLGNRVFEEIINFSFLRWNYPGVRVRPESNDWSSFKRKEREVWGTETTEGKAMWR